MTLRRRFLLYLILVHLVFAACAVWFLRAHSVWLIALEAFFVISIAAGWRLQRSFFEPLSLIRSGAFYLREGEFTTRFTPTGQEDMDQLLDVYNRMVDILREERVRNEEQEQLLRKVLAESPGGVVTLDVAGRLSSVNPAAEALLGDPADRLLGRPLKALESPLARELDRLGRDESRVVVLSGRRRVRCRAATFMDRGFARRFLLLDELTDELRRTEKVAYEKLIRMMSHEVNNTSGAVQSLLQSCLVYRRQLADGDREDFARALEIAIERTAHLDAFMRGFADVVRLPHPRKQEVDPWELALRVLVLFRERCAVVGVVLREERGADLPPVQADAIQIEQVLMNVLKNAVEAVEATGAPGEIVLQAGRRDRRFFLAVRDSGPGLSEEVQSHLFTPFYTTREKGQGIGLTMVQEILVAHGFGFTLENAPGGGAVFTILF